MSSNPDGTLTLTHADVSEDDNRVLDLFLTNGTGMALQQSLPASLIPLVAPEPVSPAFTG